MIVLDTNVISEPLKSAPAQTVIEWLDAQVASALFVPAICLAELFAGVQSLPAGKRRTALQHALEVQISTLFHDRILAFDAAAAQAFASVHASAVRHGHNISFADCAIAAIASAHGYAIATRNVKDFRGTGIKVVDPWRWQ